MRSTNQQSDLRRCWFCLNTAGIAVPSDGDSGQVSIPSEALGTHDDYLIIMLSDVQHPLYMSRYIWHQEVFIFSSARRRREHAQVYQEKSMTPLRTTRLRLILSVVTALLCSNTLAQEGCLGGLIFLGGCVQGCASNTLPNQQHPTERSCLQFCQCMCSAQRQDLGKIANDAVTNPAGSAAKTAERGQYCRSAQWPEVFGPVKGEPAQRAANPVVADIKKPNDSKATNICICAAGTYSLRGESRTTFVEQCLAGKTEIPAKCRVTRRNRERVGEGE